MHTLPTSLRRPTFLAISFLQIVIGGVVVLDFLSIAKGAQEAPPEGRSPLSQEISVYQDSGTDLFQLLNRAGSEYGFPVGVELDGTHSTHLISVKVEHGTVRDVINSIISQAGGYKWVEVNGVINVIPGESGIGLLNTRIGHFHVRDASAQEIREAIASLPEVANWLDKNQVSERSIVSAFVPLQMGGLPRISLDLHDVRLREIMNSIIKTRGFRSWCIARYGEGNRYLSISIS
jgi:hypothetical protein